MMMISQSFVFYPIVTALGLYVFSFVLNLIPEKVFRSKRIFVLMVMWFAFAFTFLAMIFGGLKGSKVPFQTLHESLVLFSACVTFIYLTLRFKFKIDYLNNWVTTFSFIILLYAVVKFDTEVALLPPALQSFWFVPHVLLYFLGYGLLTFSCVSSIYVFYINKIRRAAVNESVVRLSYVSMFAGLLLLTFGLITGSIWAQRAWGDYWAWDPKENWALISWLIYLVIVHRFRTMKSVRVQFVVLNIIAYGIVLFTYLGIQFLPTAEKSKHIYKESYSEKPQRKPVSLNQ
jgi:ABC-type transport system involved in cytochrome c biogenesis permease subunit